MRENDHNTFNGLLARLIQSEEIIYTYRSQTNSEESAAQHRNSTDLVSDRPLSLTQLMLLTGSQHMLQRGQ
jgi:hypothetical protein